MLVIVLRLADTLLAVNMACQERMFMLADGEWVIRCRCTNASAIKVPAIAADIELK
jgi:hypothetical protein